MFSSLKWQGVGMARSSASVPPLWRRREGHVPLRWTKLCLPWPAKMDFRACTSPGKNVVILDDRQHRGYTHEGASRKPVYWLIHRLATRSDVDGKQLFSHDMGVPTLAGGAKACWIVTHSVQRDGRMDTHTPRCHKRESCRSHFSPARLVVCWYVVRAELDD